MKKLSTNTKKKVIKKSKTIAKKSQLVMRKVSKTSAKNSIKTPAKKTIKKSAIKKSEKSAKQVKKQRCFWGKVGGLVGLTIVVLAVVLGSVFGLNKKHTVTEIFENVLDAGTYQNIDFEFAENYFAEIYDNWNHDIITTVLDDAGGCTAVVKNLGDNTIVGRNMDLTISEKPAYVFKTDIAGKYQTLNLMYTYRDFAPTTAEAKNGLSDDFYRILPFSSQDVLNEKGLYIEINMREGEGDAYENSGTNPNSSERVYLATLPFYIGLNAADIDEALEYVKTLDIYSMDDYWNFAFMMADATGRYGVLEIAGNEFYWNEGADVQANFYVNTKLRANEEKTVGLGRYVYAKINLENIANETDMFNLMDDLSYSNVYRSDAKFDNISEFIGYEDGWTLEYLTAEENQVELDEYFSWIYETFDTLTTAEKMEYGTWLSALTEIIDINEKTITVRFFEDEEKVYTLGF